MKETAKIMKSLLYDVKIVGVILSSICVMA